MKVGIMSMQRVKNHGSFLQAYALEKFIKSNVNCDVSFIDFKTEKGIADGCRDTFEALKKRKVKYFIIKTVCLVAKVPGLKQILLKSKKIKTWVNMMAFFNLYCKRYEKSFWKKLPLSNKTLKDSDIDALIIGSDEVFNYSINHRVGYSDELFAKDSPAKINISFAGCFGCTTKDDLIGETKDKIKGCLEKFDAISVRDMNSFHLMKYLLGEDAKVSYHLDPVFHYDFKDELVPIKRKKPYLALYSYTGMSQEEKDKIKRYAESKGLDVLCFLGYQADLGTFMDVSPFEVLSYIKNAECVITTTFHGVVFASKFNKSFSILIRKKKNGVYGNEEKVGDMLNRLSLTDRIIETFDDIEESLSKPISFDKANEHIKECVEDARVYLTNWLTRET